MKGQNSSKNKKLALNLGIQTYQILTNDDEVCIPSLSSILLAVPRITSGILDFSISTKQVYASSILVYREGDVN